MSRSEVPPPPNLDDYDDYARFNLTTIIVSRPNTYVKTAVSNFKGDIGGTVYPLLDIRDVVPKPAFLLEGLGLIYKRPTHTTEVGYVAFSLRGVNRKRFLEQDFSPAVGLDDAVAAETADLTSDEDSDEESEED